MEFWKKSRAVFFLFFTFFIWGSVYVGGRMVSDMPPGLVACMRCAIATIPLLAMARRHFGVKIAKEDWKYFIGVGGLGYFMTMFLVQCGITLTGASNAALINSVTPVSVTLFAALILKEKITKTKVFCLFLAFAGAVIINFGASGGGEVLGTVLVLLSVMSWGVASVNMRQLTAKYPPILVTAYGMVISLIFHVPSAIFGVVQAGEANFSAKGLLVLLYLGVCGSGLAQYTWTACLAVLPASTCSLFYPLQPMFSALLGSVLLDETLRPTFYVGMLIISVDVILSTLETRKIAAEQVQNAEK